MHLQNSQKRFDFHQHDVLAFGMGQSISTGKARCHDHHIIGLIFLAMVVQTRIVERRIGHFAGPTTLGINNGNISMFPQGGGHADIRIAASTNFDRVKS